MTPLRQITTLRIGRGDYFYGPGIHQLLCLVARRGSLREACAEMSLSYSKGLRMVARLEAEVGCRVLLRKAGGAGGGGATLTEEGRAWMARYEAYCAECGAALEEIFARHFAESGGEL